MSTVPDSNPNQSFSVATHRSVKYRAVRWITALALAVTVSGGIAQSTFAQSSADTATTTPTIATTDAGSVNGEQTFSVADVAAKANPAVVTIYTYTDQTQQSQNSQGGIFQIPSNGKNGNGNANGGQGGDIPSSNGTDGTSQEVELGAGSGWIYDSAGHVVTNNHVVAGANKFVVEYADGTKVDATLVGTDSFQDVAVLQLDLSNGAKVPGVATIGDSSKMRAGDQVVAIGTPLGEFQNTVSEGIIGGLNRSLDTGEGYDLDNLIQHDAPLSPGNSGGPLLNMNGEVIGMNVAKVEYQESGGGASATGLDFAIDGNTVDGIVKQIIANKGDVALPYLGISTQELQDGTVQVAQVQSGSPADSAGIQDGDVITKVDGTQVSSDNPLLNLIFEHQPGDKVTLTVLRNGQTQTIDITLGTRPADAQ